VDQRVDSVKLAANVALFQAGWFACVPGAVGGPAAWGAGARLGALDFTVAGAAMAAIALRWAVLAPLLLLKVSGVTLLEKDIGDRRPAYRDYSARTNAFFPGPRREA